MHNLIRADLYKLRRSAGMKILICSSTLGALLLIWIAHLVAEGDVGHEISGAASFFSDVQMMALLGTVTAGIYIVGDFENKTIHDAIATGSGRATVILSKTLTYFILIFLLLLPYILLTLIGSLSDETFASFVPSPFLQLLTDAGGTTVTAADMVKMTAIMLTVFVSYAAQLSISILIAFLFRRTVLVIAIGYGVIFLSGQLSALSDSVAWLEALMAWTPFAYNFPTMDTDTGQLLKAIGASILFTGIIVAITGYVFRKSEIK